MKLIYTHDGLIGMDFDKDCDIIWCHTIDEVINIANGYYGAKMKHEAPTKEELEKDIRVAVDHMAKHSHDIAEFGVFGTFLYSHKEESSEF